MHELGRLRWRLGGPCRVVVTAGLRDDRVRGRHARIVRPIPIAALRTRADQLIEIRVRVGVGAVADAAFVEAEVGGSAGAARDVVEAVELAVLLERLVGLREEDFDFDDAGLDFVVVGGGFGFEVLRGFAHHHYGCSAGCIEGAELMLDPGEDFKDLLVEIALQGPL